MSHQLSNEFNNVGPMAVDPMTAPMGEVTAYLLENPHRIVEVVAMLHRKTSPDLLALQARVTQLEAVIKNCVDELRYFDQADSLVADLSAALSAPVPNVSPLWWILAEADRWVVAGEQEGDHSKNAIAGYYFLRENVKALTPELRALIEEMAKDA